MADGAGLENRYGETHRGFESHALRMRYFISIPSSGDFADPQVVTATARLAEPRISAGTSEH